MYEESKQSFASLYSVYNSLISVQDSRIPAKIWTVLSDSSCNVLRKEIISVLSSGFAITEKLYLSILINSFHEKEFLGKGIDKCIGKISFKCSFC